MNIKEVDQLISSFLITGGFMFLLFLVFLFDLGLILNFKSTIVFNYVVLLVWSGVYYALNKLDITLLSDICKYL